MANSASEYSKKPDQTAENIVLRKQSFGHSNCPKSPELYSFTGVRFEEQPWFHAIRCKKTERERSEAMGKICSSLAYGVALALALVVVGGNAQAQTATSKAQSSQKARSCTKDEQCPSRQRCGFTGDCKSKGKCIVPTHNTSCIDPGGRCGCDGRPVEIFCEVGSQIAYTSAPVNAVGPCPRPCTEDLECATNLVCQKGFCVKP